MFFHDPPLPSLSLVLSAAYGILISAAALCSFELIGRRFGIGDHGKGPVDQRVGARWFYAILFLVGISAVAYLPQAFGLGSAAVYGISGALSFFPLYFLFLRRWGQMGLVTPWSIEKKALRKELPQYVLAFAILLAIFILTYIYRHPL